MRVGCVDGYDALGGEVPGRQCLDDLQSTCGVPTPLDELLNQRIRAVQRGGDTGSRRFSTPII